MKLATFAALLAGAGQLVVLQANARATTITFTETLPGSQAPNVFTLTVPGSGAQFTGDLFHSGPPGLPGPIEIDLNEAGTWTLGLIAGRWYATVQGATDPPGGGREQFAAIPEPATGVLLGAGLALVGLALARRRRHD